MADWKLISDRLYASLKAMPCRCEFAKEWSKTETELERRVTKRCSKCIAIELYEQAVSS